MLRDFLFVTKALSDLTRVRILKVLQDGEMCVCQIGATLDLGQSCVSQQLAVLRKAGLIEDERKGRWVFYRLAEKHYNKYAERMLSVLGTCLEEDDLIKQDRERCRGVRGIPLEEICSGKSAKTTSSACQGSA